MGLLAKEYLNMINDIKYYKSEHKLNDEMVDNYFELLKYIITKGDLFYNNDMNDIKLTFRKDSISSMSTTIKNTPFKQHEQILKDETELVKKSFNPILEKNECLKKTINKLDAKILQQEKNINNL